MPIKIYLIVVGAQEEIGEGVGWRLKRGAASLSASFAVRVCLKRLP
jgi:hypothetical protein